VSLRSLHLPALLLTLFTFASACGSDDAAGGFDLDADPLVTATSESGELEVEIRTAPQPPAKGLVAVRLQVADAATGAPVDGLQIEVAPWMGSMGHGSNQVTATATGPGTYEASGVLFSMPGPWELRLTIAGSRSDSLVTSSFDVLP